MSIMKLDGRFRKNESIFYTFAAYCIIAVAQQTMAATYYVSLSGDDNKPGTSTETAWRTIDKVNTVHLNPGDRVLFEAGREYPGNLLLTAEDAGTPTQPVVIGSYGTGRATIKAGDGSGVTVRNAGGIVVENLVVTGDDYRTNSGSGVKIVNELPNNQKLEYIRVHNVEASDFGKGEKSVPGGFQYGNGGGVVVGGYASDKSKSGYANVRITDCVCYLNEYCGIATTGWWQDDPDTYANSNVYVGHCSVYDNPGDPNFLKNHSGSGILMEDVDGGIIEYCEAYNNGYDCNSRGGPCGIWAAVANNVIIQHCESHHNRTGMADGDGFDFDGGTTNSILQYNYSHDNDGAGYLICSYENAPHTFSNNTVRYNISVNDACRGGHGAISLYDGGPTEDPICNTRIYGNTVYSSTNPVIFFEGGRGIHNTQVFNNLFIAANNQTLVQGNPSRATAVFAGNAYWAVKGAFDVAGYKTLEEWRQATGQEMLNGKPVGLVVDPELKDMGSSVTVGNMTKLHTLTAWGLRNNSPLIDAGLDLRSLFGIDPGRTDFCDNRVPQGNGYEIGACEITSETNAASHAATIHLAAFAGDVSTVKSLIEAGVFPDARDQWGSVPLHWAIIADHMDVCKLLITKGADINAKNVLGRTPLLRLLSQSRHVQAEDVEFFIRNGADVNGRNEDGFSPLHFAVTGGQEDLARLLIERKADVNAKNDNGKTPLDMAVLVNNKDIIQLLVSRDAEMSLPIAVRHKMMEQIKNLLDRGTDIDAKDEEGQTLLHIAVRARQIDVAKLLISEGADVNTKDGDGRTPVLLAVSEGHADVAKFLIENGGSVNTADASGRLPLFYALWQADANVVTTLLDNGADVNAKNERWVTMLHWAVMRGNRQGIELVLAAGADVNPRNKAGETPLDVAAYGSSPAIGELLVAKGAQISSPHAAAYLGDLQKVKAFIDQGADVDQKKGLLQNTPLHSATVGGCIEVAEFLISKGADVNAQTRVGLAPLHMAADKGFLDIVQLLLKAGANVNAKDRRGRTPLDLARARKHKKIVTLLGGTSD